VTGVESARFGAPQDCIRRRRGTVAATDSSHEEWGMNMPGREKRGSYAESREKQVEFEELEREEGDWQKAADDVVAGKKPSRKPDEPASSGL
jgi:hypothetical protein